MDQSADAFGLVGSTLAGHLRIESVVGAGGFGTVYRASHLKLQCPVAVKCLRVPEMFDGPARERFVTRFLGEGRLMYELSRADAGIVKALEVDVTVLPNGTQLPYLVLEWLDGQPLESVIEHRMQQGQRTPITEVIERLDPAARALGAAHDGNVAHRDIKPSNIMLTQVMGKQTAKILDFGIAKIVQETTGGGAHTTREGDGSSFGFTPCYAAPEQWVARYGATGPWTDVFSFALVCVEFLSAQPALPGESMAHWMGACLDPTQRPTPRNRGTDLGDDLEQVFLKALAIKPDERYRHVTQFWGDLKQAAGLMSQRISMSAGAQASGHAATVHAPISGGAALAGPATGPMAGPPQSLVDGLPPPPVLPPPPGTGPSAGPWGAAPPGPPAATPFGPPAGGAFGAPGPLPMPPAAPMGGGWGGHMGGTTSTGGMAMQPSPFAMVPHAPPKPSGLSPVVLGAILAGLLSIFVVMLIGFFAMVRNDDGPSGGPIANATGTLPSLGAPKGPRSMDEVLGSAGSKASDVPGTLAVFCVPSCDQVSVDGKPVGASPVVAAQVRPGRHVITVTRTGAPPQEADVFIPGGGKIAQRFWMGP